jgi:hypothetical protein
MGEEDIPWLVFLCVKKYEKRFDRESTEGWYKNIVLKSPLLFLAARTDNAFCISMLSCMPWTPTEFEVNVIMLCADDGAMWETLPLLRYSIAWSRQRKCKIWRLCSDTVFDLKPLANRVGAREISPRYMLDL